MKITHVTARVRDGIESARYYAEVLGLPVETERDLVSVAVGTTCLELIEDPEADGELHFAITVPTNKFVEAKRWLEERMGLLSTTDADEFECSPAWNARSLYFAGPDRSVLELIVRRELGNATPGPFTSADLLCVSEVGIAVPDVPSMADTLTDNAGITPYGQASGSTFAPVGDADGLLILVSPGRAWFPTQDRVARETPLAITVRGGRPGTYELGANGVLQVSP